MKLFTEFLDFIAKNYRYSKSKNQYVVRQTNNPVKNEDIFWSFMKTKIIEKE